MFPQPLKLKLAIKKPQDQPKALAEKPEYCEEMARYLNEKPKYLNEMPKYLNEKPKYLNEKGFLPTEFSGIWQEITQNLVNRQENLKTVLLMEVRQKTVSFYKVLGNTADRPERVFCL